MSPNTGLLSAAFVFIVLGSQTAIPPAMSFHLGGVGSCGNCHSMHSSKDGGKDGEKKKSSMLLATDPSSVCLNCHAGPGGDDNISVFSADGSALTPGGDFYWLTKTFTWAGGSSPGERHGHNVVAADFNLAMDLHLDQSPGGRYRSTDLGCTSCHDPHGRAFGGTQAGSLPVSVSGSYGEQPPPETTRGNYRLLGGVNYSGGKAAQDFSFTFGAPVARQDSNGSFGESDGSHVDYGAGMSEWCGNCHETVVHNNHAGAGNFEHPVGSTANFSNETAAMYNTYISTGDLLDTGTGTGNADTAYLQFVPFERGTSNPEQLNPTSRKGPNPSSRIMCLSCHRAHASAFRSIGRWDFDAAVLAESHPAEGDGGVSGRDVSHSYYGRNIAVEFGPDQGPFCEKCHGIIEEPPPEADPEHMWDPTPASLPDTSLPPLPGTDPILRGPFQP